MDDRPIVDSWLRSLGHLLGWPLSLDARGVCAIGHASGLDCAIEVPPEGGCVVLRAPLMDWHPVDQAGLAVYCLQRQFMGEGTGQASFGLDKEDAELVLWQVARIAELDDPSFHRLVMSFLDQAVRCLDDLETFCQKARGSLSEETEPRGEEASEMAAAAVRIARTSAA